MSLRNDNIERRTNHFRTSMDIGMGFAYASVGVILLYAKTWGHFEVPAVAAYPIGVLLVVGGAFRFWRGLRVLLPKKKDAGN